VVIDASLSLPPHLNLFNQEAETIVFNADKAERSARITWEKIDFQQPVAPQILSRLYERKLISLIIEGGARTLRSFIDAGLWDEARVFVSPSQFGSGISAPRLPQQPSETSASGDDSLMTYTHQDLESRLGL
jgi:diaminohydroxyphosphoribosylaminopyrimidine deaminase/5-amino-6-(5-phosphoribosylamino)uracil reductase